MTYHTGDRLMIHQVNTHRLVFAASIRDKILPNIRDSDDEFLTRDAPSHIKYGKVREPY